MHYAIPSLFLPNVSLWFILYYLKTYKSAQTILMQLCAVLLQNTLFVACIFYNLTYFTAHFYLLTILLSIFLNLLTMNWAMPCKITFNRLVRNIFLRKHSFDITWLWINAVTLLKFNATKNLLSNSCI